MGVESPQSHNPQEHTAQLPTSTQIDGTTVFGQMDVGGASIDLTFNYLHEMLRSLEARFDVQSDQTKNQGVVFHDQAFPSEREFLSWYLPLNPLG